MGSCRSAGLVSVRTVDGHRGRYYYSGELAQRGRYSQGLSDQNRATDVDDQRNSQFRRVLNTATYANPVTLASGAYIVIPSGDAVLGQAVAWTIVNNGYVRADGTNNAGIRLAAGGTVTNDVGGTIFGEGGIGVAVAGAGSVINDGEIAGSVGVTLNGGDFVTNGFINNITHVRTLGTISGDAYGVSGSAGSVSNIGTIGAIGTMGVGVGFTGTGTVTNIYGTISARLLPAFVLASAASG